MKTSPPSAHSGHRSMASVDSHTSGIAASAISFGGESLRLSQFPPPPTEIPNTPTQAEFSTPTPTRTHFTLDTPPATPKRSRQFNIPSVPQRKEPSSVVPKQIQLADSSRFRRTAKNKSSAQMPAGSRTIPRHPLQDKSPSSQAATPLRPISPYDWHEGASSVDLDPAEDRLLSTSFITSLLSSTEPRDGTRSYSPISFSDTSYAFSSRFTASPASTRPPLPTPAPLRSLPSQSQPHSRGPPPSAYPPVANEVVAPSSRPSSSDSVTLHSALGHDSTSVARNASISRGVRVSGVTMVGAASAKLPNLDDDDDGQHHPHKSQSNRSDILSRLQAEQEHATLADRSSIGDLDVNQSRAGPSMLLSSALPLTSGAQMRFPREGAKQQHETRQSQYSTRTTKSYVSSFISRASAVASAHSAMLKNALGWRTVKPLPPIPTLPHLSLAAEAERRRLEERLPMPHLVSRADTLVKMLEKGDYPHDRLDATGREKIGTESFYKNDGAEPGVSYPESPPYQSSRDRKTKQRSIFPTGHFFNPAKRKYNRNSIRKTRRVIISVSLFVILLVVIAVVVGVIEAKKRRSSHPSNCVGNQTGASCSLDATCICTTPLPGQCGDLASGLISLIPTVNKLFQMDVTPASLSTAIWRAQGVPIAGNCGPQVLLVDVSPGLDPITMPNRTQWAQSALLWNLVQSQDLTAVKRIRTFVNNAPWKHLGGADADTASKFQISASGFIFDFATQTVTQPNISFVSSGEPTNAQKAQVGPTAQVALDRMYSYAFASSSQRQTAWATYWQTTLQQRPEDLSIFMSSIASSPLLIPFNASSTLYAGLLTNSTTTPFPPPVGCYPALSPDQVRSLNTVENGVFDLPPLSNSGNNQFDISCFPGRPLYGVLDILQLRLPFVDSRTGVARQAAVLKPDVAPRAVVYSGELLSSLPSSSALSNFTVSQMDPRQYGTLNHFNHVILNYFTSITDVNIARALVTFFLSSRTVPPSNDTLLYQSLSSLPMLEVAVFGNIDPSDISSSVSSFATDSGSLFFGSDQAAALRSWAITGTRSSVVWTELASSAQVVRDTSLTDSTFNSVWNPAAVYLHSNHPGVTVGVSNITAAFQAVGKFGP